MGVFYRNYLARKDHEIDDEILSQALESLGGAALKFSADVISDEKQRDNYNRNVKRVKDEVLAQVKVGKISVKDAAEFCYDARNKIMAEVRAKTSVNGLAVAEAKKKVPASLEKLLDEKSTGKFSEKFAGLDENRKKVIYYEIVESSARPATKFNTLNKVLKVSGKVLIVVTIAYATYEIANADNKQKEVIKQGVTISGGAAGTALAGLAVSTVCGPGAPFCAIGLMLAAGVASGWAASKLVDSMDDEIEEFTKWKIS